MSVEPYEHEVDRVPGGVVMIEEDLDALMPVDEWLALVASDEPVVLSRPAAAYLSEAREAGEV